MLTAVLLAPQEMFAEYFRALRQPATPVRTFRLRAVLFPAVEQSMTEEELADGAEFFTTCAPLSLCRCKLSGLPHELVILLSSDLRQDGTRKRWWPCPMCQPCWGATN